MTDRLLTADKRIHDALDHACEWMSAHLPGVLYGPILAVMIVVWFSVVGLLRLVLPNDTFKRWWDSI